MTLAEKLSAIYTAKLDIREAIKSKGIALTNSEPFSLYAAKILLIDGSGDNSDGENNGQIFSVADTATLIFIPMWQHGAFEVVNFNDKVGGNISENVVVIYPPTAQADRAEAVNFAEMLCFSPIETADFSFSLWAIAESFKPSTAFRYDYDADWLEFTASGAYVRDRTLTSGGAVEGVTDNGAYFATPFPNRQSYGNIIKLQVKIEVNANG